MSVNWPGKLSPLAIFLVRMGDGSIPRPARDLCRNAAGWLVWPPQISPRDPIPGYEIAQGIPTPEPETEPTSTTKESHHA